MKKIVAFIFFCMCFVAANTQSYLVQYDLCEFHIQLPYFVKLSKTAPLIPQNTYCSYKTIIVGYGELSISTNTIEDDYFKGNPQAMFESIRENTNIYFDDDKSSVSDNGFIIYGENDDSINNVYVCFIYTKNIQAGIRYDYPKEKSTRIQVFIDALSKTFKAN